jgi:hypothetical protein
MQYRARGLARRESSIVQVVSRHHIVSALTLAVAAGLGGCVIQPGLLPGAYGSGGGMGVSSAAPYYYYGSPSGYSGSYGYGSSYYSYYGDPYSYYGGVPYRYPYPYAVYPPNVCRDVNHDGRCDGRKHGNNHDDDDGGKGGSPPQVGERPPKNPTRGGERPPKQPAPVVDREPTRVREAGDVVQPSPARIVVPAKSQAGGSVPVVRTPPESPVAAPSAPARVEPRRDPAPVKASPSTSPSTSPSAARRVGSDGSPRPVRDVSPPSLQRR